jgi:hypothetical protein
MSPDCPPDAGPRPRRPRVTMPEFTSLVRPAGPGMLRRTELSERIFAFRRLDFLLAAFFFATFFFKGFFLGAFAVFFFEAVFLRIFFFVGMRKVYHHQMRRTMRDWRTAALENASIACVKYLGGCRVLLV